jgi:hypothetical protein
LFSSRLVWHNNNTGYKGFSAKTQKESLHKKAKAKRPRRVFMFYSFRKIIITDKSQKSRRNIGIEMGISARNLYNPMEKKRPLEESHKWL